MTAIRRAYIYIACIAGLETVTWAVISLLRNLLVPGKVTSLESTALQIAIIVIGLPIYLVHWLWAQRLAGRKAEERGAVLRRLYLYGAMAGFLGPFIANVFDLLGLLMGRGLGLQFETWRYFGQSPSDVMIHHLVAMVVLALLWVYHRRVAAADTKAIAETGGASTVRRLYIYGFSAAGLVIVILAVVYLSRWLMFQLGAAPIITRQADLVREVARLAVGLPLWLVFWRWAERRFAGPDEEEQASVLRKVYLYLAVFLGVLATVTTLTMVLADVLGRILGTGLSGGGDIRQALAILIGAGLVWAYHGYILHRDAALAGEPATTAWVGRLYRYLVATIGLAALLVGLGGGISVLIRHMSGVRIIQDGSEAAAWFTALIIAGLPVWILPWRRLQVAATATGPAGDEESNSVIRKVYLYFFLLVATLTVLSSGVYIVFRLISLALGAMQQGNLLSDLSQAIAYTLIAVGVWLYHGSILRADGQRAQEEQAQRLSALHVAVMDAGNGSLGRALMDELQRELPGLDLQPLGLTAEAAAALGTTTDRAAIAAVVAAADLIVGPWTVAVGAEGVGAEIAQAVSASPAHKVLIPAHVPGWNWVGLGDLESRDAVRAVKQVVAGKEVKASHGLSAGAIIAIVFGALVLLLSIVIPLIGFLASGL